MCVGGTAVAAGVGCGAAGAVDAAGTLGVDTAFGAADFAAADAADVAAATVPDISAEAGLSTLDETFGTFSPDLFAANSADVAAGGFGTDLTAGAAGEAGTFAAAPATDAVDTGFFGGTVGDTTTGAGFGTGSDIGASAGAPFDTAAGAPGGGIGQEPGTFEAANPEAANSLVQPDVGDPSASFSERFDAVNTPSSTPTVSDQGIVSSEPISGGAGGGGAGGGQFTAQQLTDLTGLNPNETSAFISPSGTVDFEGLGNAAINAEVPGGGAFPSAQPGILDPNFLESAQLGPGETSFDPGAFQPTDTSSAFINSAPGTNLPASEFDPTISAGGPNPSIAQLQGAPGATPATPDVPGATPAAPGATTGPTSAVPAAAGGGVSPLTALRAGTIGANAITAGINLNNAFNQPNYSALLPTAYPGGPTYSPYYSSSVPGAPGSGGIAGGLATQRLTNGLVAGASPQQLAQSGIITPARATQLQATYEDITQQYAHELGVSPQSLSPGIKQMIAAQALADMGLGGR